MNLRKITSLTLLVSFLVLLLTSVVLYIEPSGRVAYWSGWSLWGLSKPQWGAQHLNSGVLFLLAGALHIYYNFNAITAYLKNRAKKLTVTPAFNVSVLITLLVCLGTYFEIPPFSTVVDLGSAITDRANAKYGEPPYGHAELSSLKSFARRVELDLEQTKKLLAEAGISVASDTEKILDIARANNITPQALYDIIKPAKVRMEGSTFPDEPPPGFGRKTLAEVCTEYKLHIPTVTRALKKKGITPDLNKTIKDLAQSSGMEPMSVFEIIHDAVVAEE